MAMKVLARDDEARPFDRADLLALLARAQPSDLEETRRCLSLIAERGYDRGRDLLGDFETLLSR